MGRGRVGTVLTDDPRCEMMRRAAFYILLASLVSACSDEAPPYPTPTSPARPNTPTPPDNSGLLRMSGRVLDENGIPVPGALVEVDYQSNGAISSPPSSCPGVAQFCWLATRTNDLGEYSVEFAPTPWSGFGLGYVFSFREGYEVDVQAVPTTTSPAVRDLRPRPTRSIRAGDSTVVVVDATSSLCLDLEDLYRMDSRCEVVVIESGAGLLDVEALPTADGAVPSIFWYTSGNYTGRITRPRPGAVTIPVGGGTYRVLVGVPEGAPSQQFKVTTSLR